MDTMLGRVLAIDPDPNGGSWVLFREDQSIQAHGWQTPIVELADFAALRADHVVVEGFQSYGMPVGASTFETVKCIGELRCACRLSKIPLELDDELTRPKLKAALCHDSRAKDPNVRAALIDLYGGDKRTAVGLKASPGPLYGVSKDVWSALALGIVWLSLHGLGPLAEREGGEE